MQKVDINLGSPSLTFPFGEILNRQPNSPSFPFKKLFRRLSSLSAWPFNGSLSRWSFRFWEDGLWVKTQFSISFFVAPFVSFRSFDALCKDSWTGVFLIWVLFLICGLFLDASIIAGDVRFEPHVVMKSTPVAIAITKLRSVLVIDCCSLLSGLLLLTFFILWCIRVWWPDPLIVMNSTVSMLNKYGFIYLYVIPFMDYSLLCVKYAMTVDWYLFLNLNQVVCAVCDTEQPVCEYYFCLYPFEFWSCLKSLFGTTIQLLKNMFLILRF